ncbi:hypothetical protein AVEN_107137-1 [Araneus ventricosus]|uniref:Uncharacterized protein n=2 Tax=Araneus ventricosus TaxID=182803 RepID=A0A4Y2WGN6_ARAVE|nr:hypothetical protein AVEN_107137-1 [Araneus ventricosus]
MMEWFCRIAWNMALKKGTEVRNVFECFDVCCRFLEKIKGSQVRLKDALIFVVAAGIQTLRENNKTKEMGEEGKIISRKILSSIDMCRNIEKDNSKILSLLYVYEFETRILMEDLSAETVLKQMLQLPFVDAETLQLVASIAYHCDVLTRFTAKERNCMLIDIVHLLFFANFVQPTEVHTCVDESRWKSKQGLASLVVAIVVIFLFWPHRQCRVVFL